MHILFVTLGIIFLLLAYIASIFQISIGMAVQLFSDKNQEAYKIRVTNYGIINSIVVFILYFAAFKIFFT